MKLPFTMGMVKEKVDPWPGSPAAQILPPCRSTIRLQIARPMPVPGYLPRLWSRWKTRNSLSWYSCLKPMPLSRTLKSQLPLVFGDRDVDLRRPLRAAELDGVADEVLE